MQEVGFLLTKIRRLLLRRRHSLCVAGEARLFRLQFLQGHDCPIPRHDLASLDIVECV